MATGHRRRRVPDRGLDGPTPETAAADSEPADPESVGRGLLLRKLTAAPATRSQLADLLASRGIASDVADALLDRFEEVGLINDSEYAAQWVQSRQAGRGLARRALRQEMSRKGLSDEVINDSLASITLDDERAAAETLVRRKLRSTAPLDYAVRVRRLVGLLARKGYSPGLAMSVVRDALAHEGDEFDRLVNGTVDVDL